MNNESIFYRLGWEIIKSGKEDIYNCPFCDKDKMYVNSTTTQFNCKVCNKSGNEKSVLDLMFTEIYKPALKTKEAKKLIKQICEDRSIDSKAFKLEKNVGFNDGELVWIVRSEHGKPVTLRHTTFKRRNKKVEIRNMKGTTTGILGLEYVKKLKADEPVYIVEGEWDRLAGNWMLNCLGEAGVFVALPGANNFKITEAKTFAGKRTVTCLDNDTAGVEGTKGINNKCGNYGLNLRNLVWKSKAKEGYDIGDLIADRGFTKAFKYIHKNLVEPENKSSLTVGTDWDPEREKLRIEQEQLEPITIEEVHETFNKWLELENCDLIDVTLATALSATLPGKPLWMFIVAPPASAKTDTIEAFSDYYRSYNLSDLTSKALVSGSASTGRDPSLLGRLEGKDAILTIKDLTPLLQANENERDAVFGILRDSYDGSFSKIYGNNVERNYKKLHYSLIAAVTPMIDEYGTVIAGERALKFRSEKELSRADDIAKTIKAIQNTGMEDEKDTELREVCLRILRNEERKDVPLPDDEFSIFVSDVAHFCTRARSVAPSDKYSGIQTSHPTVEVSTRVGKQLTKFAQGCAILYNADTLMDERILRLVKRVAIHTPDIITMKIIKHLYDRHEQTEIVASGISGVIKNFSIDTVRFILGKLARTETIYSEKTITGKTVYKLTDEVYEIIEKTKLFHNLPKNDPLHTSNNRLVLRRKK